MTIDAILNPAEIALLPQRDMSDSVCVVFDILRATSSMTTALAHGAAEIWPARSIEEARALQAELPEALLGGERHGERIEGFDIGNSPFEYRDLAGRTIISTTTNGTIALRACEGARSILVGALLNLAALADQVHALRAESLLLVCAGTFSEFALEDAFAAGRLIDALGGEPRLTDSARAALAVSRTYGTPVEALRLARNGRALLAKNRGAELEWCAQESYFKVVGAMREGVIRLSPLEGAGSVAPPVVRAAGVF
jgi:2-phosphosulfolactate phosphatase